MVQSVSFGSRYFIEYETGEGTFGQVMVVQDKKTGAKRNAKTVTKLNRNLDLVEVTKTLRGLQQLSHPHVCNIDEYVEDDGVFYLLSDHMEGGELQDFLERIVSSKSWLEERTIALYAQQILMATTYMHHHGVLHGELKPTSILLSSKLPDAQVRVTDFGISQIFDPCSVAIRLKPTCFMPPEFIDLTRMEEASEKVDMWGIGAITFLMLVNKLPYPDGLHPKELAHALSKPPRFYADDGWAERSWMSRDFIRSLLCKVEHRLTAAQALSHEWIRTLASEHYIIPPNLSSVNRPCVSKRRPDEKNIITCGLLIAAALIPTSVFESHLDVFRQMDGNGDGYVLTEDAEKLWAQKWTQQDVKRVLSYVALTGIVDMSTFAVVGVLLESEATRQAPSAMEAGKLLAQQAFKIFDIRGTVRANDILHKVKTQTAKLIEESSLIANASAPVCFNDIASAVPSDRAVDFDGFCRCIDQHDGSGTPCAMFNEDVYTEEDLDTVPWVEQLRNWSTILQPLATCGFAETFMRRRKT